MRILETVKKIYEHSKSLVFKLNLKPKDTFNISKMKGEIFVSKRVRDPLTGAFSPWSEKELMFNVVTDGASVVLARLMKDPTEPMGGVQYFALGTGNIGWDAFNPPPPDPAITTLEAEVGRVAPTSATFIDPNTFLPTATPTNIVDFDFIFGESDAVGPLKECALFGGDATASANTGTPLTDRTFPVISKTSFMELAFTYRLTF